MFKSLLITIILLLSLAAPLYGVFNFNTNLNTILTDYIFWILTIIIWHIFILNLGKFKNSKNENTQFTWFINLYFIAFLSFHFVVLLVLLKHFQHQQNTLLLIIATLLSSTLLLHSFNKKICQFILFATLSIVCSLLISLTSFSLFTGSLSWESFIASASLAFMAGAYLLSFKISKAQDLQNSSLTLRAYGVFLLLAPSMVMILCMTHRVSKYYFLVVFLIPLILRLGDARRLKANSKTLQLQTAGLFGLFSLILLLAPLLEHYVLITAQSMP